MTWRVGTVVDHVRETPSAHSILLDVPDWPGHRPGEHVDVRLTAEDGYQAQRSYSIASAPGDPRLAITVERLADGEVSPYLVDELRRGDELELRGPIGGYFVWEPADGGPLLLVGGGSGVVPLVAMIRHRARLGSHVPVRLLVSARALEHVYHRRELDALAADSPGLEVTYTLTRSTPDGWSGLARRVDRPMLMAVGWSSAERPLALTCGPTAFVEGVADALVRLGYEPSRVKTERFGPSGS